MDEKVLLKVVEYEGGNGNWYITATQQKAGWKWRYIPNMLKLDVTSYIELLKKYGAIGFIYKVDTDCLLYHFNSKEKAHKWVLYVNKCARNSNYTW
jgi:hypothetical protein